VIVGLHHVCWQRLMDFVVELNEMWQQRLDKLQTMLSKFLNFLGTNSCSDSYVQSFLELVGQLTHICIFPSKLQSIVNVLLSNLFYYVLSCQYDGLCQDYAVDLLCLDKVQIGAWLNQFYVILPLENKLKLHKHSIFWNSCMHFLV